MRIHVETVITVDGLPADPTDADLYAAARHHLGPRVEIITATTLADTEAAMTERGHQLQTAVDDTYRLLRIAHGAIEGGYATLTSAAESVLNIARHLEPHRTKAVS